MQRGVSQSGQGSFSGGADHRSRVRWSVGGTYLLLVAAHLVMASQMTGPIIYHDEALYLSVARTLAGGLPFDMSIFQGQAKFGYSVLLAPLFALPLDPQTIYRLVLGLNAFFSQLAFFFLYALARRYLRLAVGSAIAAAALCCLTPSFFLHTNVAMTGNAFVPVFLLTVVALGRFARTGSLGDGLMFALAEFWLYAIHSRILGLVPVAAVFVVVIWRLGRAKGVPTLAALLTLGVGMALTKGFENALYSTLRVGQSVPPPAEAGAGLLALLSAEGLRMVAGTVGGHYWYLCLASIMLVPLGLFECVAGWAQPQHVTPGEDYDPTATRVVLAFVLAAFGAVLAVSGVFNAATPRIDQVFYGRYMAGVITPIMLVGAARVLRSAESQFWRRLAFVIASPVVAILVVTALKQDVIYSDRAFNPFNVLGLYYAVGGSNWLATPEGLAAMTSVAVLVGCLLVLGTPAWLHSGRLAVIGLALLAIDVQAYMGYFLPPSRALPNSRQIEGFCARRPLAPARIGYDLDGLVVNEYYDLQWLMPKTRVDVFRASVDPIPPLDYVVADKKSAVMMQAGARIMILENFSDQAMWVMPGAQQEAGQRNHLLFPTDLSAPMPANARVADITLVEQRLNGWLVLEVGNGGDLPWASFLAWDATPGGVRLGIICSDGNNQEQYRADLPRCLYPGEAVRVLVPPPWKAWLGNGRISSIQRGQSFAWEIGIVQEGVVWFATRLHVDSLSGR